MVAEPVRSNVQQESSKTTLQSINMQQILNYIGGDFTPSHSNTFLDNTEPATGKVYSRLPDSEQQDIDAAVTAAKAALPAWQAMSTDGRCEILLKLANAIDDNATELARACLLYTSDAADD